jgi:hypothetical protein
VTLASPSRSESLRWLADRATVLLTVSGVLIYATMRLTYVQYYGLLGTSTEEVGLGYTQLLGQSALGGGFGAAVAAFLAVTIVFGIIYVIMAVVLFRVSKESANVDDFRMLNSRLT